MRDALVETCGYIHSALICSILTAGAAADNAAADDRASWETDSEYIPYISVRSM